jgi:hypothetical protein
VERRTPIIWFSRFYIAALALKVAFAIVRWDVVDAGGVQISIIISLLLWFGVMYRHSIVAKWLIVLSFVASVILSAVQLSTRPYDLFSTLVFGVALMLGGMAVWQLMTKAAHVWFEQPASSEPG